MNVEIININGKECIEIDKIECNNNTYVYFSNKIDDNDFFIRKMIATNGRIYYEGLKDNDEFDLVLMYFIKKHQNFIKDKND